MLSSNGLPSFIWSEARIRSPLPVRAIIPACCALYQKGWISQRHHHHHQHHSDERTTVALQSPRHHNPHARFCLCNDTTVLQTPASIENSNNSTNPGFLFRLNFVNCNRRSFVEGRHRNLFLDLPSIASARGEYVYNYNLHWMSLLIWLFVVRVISFLIFVSFLRMSLYLGLSSQTLSLDSDVMVWSHLALCLVWDKDKMQGWFWESTQQGLS